MKTLPLVGILLAGLAVPVAAQDTPDANALACHIALRTLDLSPEETSYKAGGNAVEISFNSGGEPGGIRCEFDDLGTPPLLTRLVHDTRGTPESSVTVEAAQSAIDDYFFEVIALGKAMDPVALSPLAGPLDASPTVPQDAAAETVEGDTVDPAIAKEGEDTISEAADKFFWCSEAMTEIADEIARNDPESKNRALIDQYMGYSVVLRTEAMSDIENEGFATSDLSELDASYKAEVQRQVISLTEEPAYTQEECDALAAPYASVFAAPAN